MQQTLEISVRGDGQTFVELVLRDQHGHLAVRICADAYAVTKLLTAWSHQYDCDADLLLLSSLPRMSPEHIDLLQRWSVVSLDGSHVHRFVSTSGVKRLLDLGAHSYRPRVVIELKGEIEAATRAAEFRHLNTGFIDEEAIQRIVDMRLRLDGLYGAWAEGELN